MKSFVAILGFAAFALGQITRDPNSVASSPDGYGSKTPTASGSSSASLTAEQWPKRISTTTASASVTDDSPFTFGASSGGPFTLVNGVSGSPTDSWGSWTASATSTESVWTFGGKTTAPAAAATSAAVSSAGGITTHAPTFFSTTKASASASSSKASSAAQATYTGAGSVGRELAYGFGAVAAGLALVF